MQKLNNIILVIRRITGNIGLNLISQVLTLLFIPILSHTYRLEDYGSFAIFLGTSALIAIFAGYRLDIAALSVDSDVYAHKLLSISIVFSCCISVFLPFLNFIHVLAGLGGLLAIVTPITIFNQSAASWLIRSENIIHISVGRFVNTLITGIAQIYCGYNHINNGLIIGFVLGAAANSLYFMFIWRPTIQRFSVKTILVDNKAFGVTSAVAAAVNTMTLQAPQFIFGIYFGSAVTGAFAISQRLTTFPISLLAQPLSQAYSGRISVALRLGKSITQEFKRYFLTVCAVGIALATGIVLVSPWVLKNLLNPSWSSAQIFLPVSAAMLLPTLIMGTIGTSLNLLRRTTTQLYWEIARLGAVCLVFFVANILNAGANMILWGLFSLLLIATGAYVCLILFPNPDQWNEI